MTLGLPDGRPVERQSLRDSFNLTTISVSRRGESLGATGRGARRRFGFERKLVVAMLLAASSLFVSTPVLGEKETPATITILLFNHVRVPSVTLSTAEGEANKILDEAGAQVDWVHCLDTTLPRDKRELCDGGMTPQTPNLRLISGGNKFQEAEFGDTAIPVLITVYYEKIWRRAHRDNADAELPVMLGCVMAHELGHLLLRAPGHSAKGIMQPQWGPVQIRQALTGHLRFTAQESTRIQSQTRLLAGLSPSVPSSIQPAGGPPRE